MKDYNAELARIQNIALDNAIQEMDATDKLGIATKEDRGDRGFLTGMASKSLGVAVRIEQILALRRGDPGGADDNRQEQVAKAKMIMSARAEVASIMERVGAGNKPRA